MVAAGRGQQFSQNVHDGRRQHVNAKETKVVAGPQTGRHQLLLGLGGRGFFDDRLHPIEAGLPGQAMAAHRAEIGQEGFAGRLHRGDGTVMGAGDLHDP